MRDSPHTLLYILILVMVTFWSANYAVGKILMREVPSVLAAGLRITLAAVFMTPLYAWQQGGGSWFNRDWPTLLALGVFGVTMNQFFFMVGLSRTSVAHSALLIGMTPVFVLLIAAAIRQERLTFRKALGMAIAIGGVLVLNTLPGRDTTPGAGPTLLGDFYVFIGAVAFALFTVFSKPVSARYSPVTVNAWCYFGGALALAPSTLWEARDFAFARVSVGAWLCLLFMSLFPSTICYLIYSYALTHISASRVAAFSYLQPVLATALAVAVLGERITLPLVAGGAVIFSGVYLTERG
jgi:drug/metabolite transporter (DMT)-like permease